MTDQDDNRAVEDEEIVVEKEWERIKRLLSQKTPSSFNMAVVEADKLFREVLSIVSFGDTVNAAIQNASDVFSDMKALMESRRVYEDIIEVPGFFVDQKTATHATDIYLQAVLDMMGKDFEEKGWWQRLGNEIIYFGESHPKLLRNVLIGALVFIVGVWFLADTVMGQWLVNLAVGLAHFVLSWVWWLVLVLAVILGVVVISWLLFERGKRG